MTKHISKPKTIGELPSDVSLGGVRFIYPGDGQAYYWFSQWEKGVWGKKDQGSGRMFPLFVTDLKEACNWELAPEEVQ